MGDARAGGDRRWADVDRVRAALRGHTWDVVVQWIAFTPADIRRDLGLFRANTRQIKRFVPGFAAKTTFADGIRRTIA